MKLSIIIPAYNEEAYLTDCIKSVIKEKNNTKHDLEIIVVNNASTDRTHEIAASFSEAIVIDEPKKGLTAARQAGFLKSSGDLIADLDADSLLAPGWIEGVANEFTKYPKLVGLSGPVIYHDLCLSTNILVRFYYYLSFLSYLLNRFIFRTSSMGQGSNFVVRRLALEKIGGHDYDFPFYGEDTELARRLNKVGRVNFSFKYPVYTSGRRFKAEGLVNTGFKYLLNYIWTIIFKKPFNRCYTDTRIKPQKILKTKTSIQNLNQSLIVIKILALILLLFFIILYIKTK